MRRHHSFRRSTTAEDGDMALALALEQAEWQRDTNPASPQPVGAELWTALQPSAARDTAQQYPDAGLRPSFYC